MVRIDKSECDVCGTCVSICPENAMELTGSLRIDQQRCISCSLCIDVCPLGALHMGSNEDSKLQEENNGSREI